MLDAIATFTSRVCHTRCTLSVKMTKKLVKQCLTKVPANCRVDFKIYDVLSIPDAIATFTSHGCHPCCILVTVVHYITS